MPGELLAAIAALAVIGVVALITRRPRRPRRRWKIGVYVALDDTDPPSSEGPKPEH